MSEVSTTNGFLAFGGPLPIAEVELDAGESRVLIDGAEPFTGSGPLAIAARRYEMWDATRDLIIDSTTEIAVPTTDVGSP